MKFNCAKCGKDANFWRSKWVFKNYSPEFYGKRLCPECITELNAKRLDAQGRVKKNTCISCGKKFGVLVSVTEWKSTEVHPEWRGLFLHSNCWNIEKRKERFCFNCGYCQETIHDCGGVDDLGSYMDESYSTFKCRKFSLDLNDENNHMAKECSSYINKNEYQDKCIKGEIGNEKQNIQIIVDFSSLKDRITKGGIVMTAYNCPKCNAMIDLPETGKVLICRYCGTPIKPVDIFEKIKSLIQ